MSELNNLYYGEVETPIGILTILQRNQHVIRIDFGDFTEVSGKIKKWIMRYFPEQSIINQPNKLIQIKKQLEEYFLNTRTNFTLDYEWYGTSFQKNVWQILMDHIPYGETRTYKEIAELIGNPNAARAIGGALNKNPLPIIGPCHRVIGSNGKMVGFGGGTEKKIYLLQHERNSL